MERNVLSDSCVSLILRAELLSTISWLVIPGLGTRQLTVPLRTDEALISNGVAEDVCLQVSVQLINQHITSYPWFECTSSAQGDNGLLLHDIFGLDDWVWVSLQWEVLVIRGI